MLATFIAIAFVDKLGRKPILYAGFVVMTIGLGVVGTMMHLGIHTHAEQFTKAAERFTTELEASAQAAAAGRPADRVLTFDGHPALRQHLRNARRAPNRWGVSVRKEHRESDKKIDLAVCAIGARMLRALVLNKAAGAKQKDGPSNVWGYKHMASRGRRR